MTSQRRQSSSYEEDSFEFVDYNTISHLEHLATSIEEALLSWGIKNLSHAVLSFDESNVKPKTLAMGTKYNLTTPHFESTESIDHMEHQTIVADNDTYKLTYHRHPQATSLGQQQYPLSFDKYYRFSTTTAHPLHRWSGIGQFFILAPSIFDSTQPRRSSNNDHQQSQTKVLLSACAIAFNNVLCTGIPVFIPVNHMRYDNYTGYMLYDAGKDQIFKIRFDSTVLPPPSPTYTNKVHELFIQHLNTDRLEKGLPLFTSANDLNILKETVFTYHYKNWYNKNWKQWEDDNNQVDGNDRRLKTLPFGPYNDPLRIITLHTILPFCPLTSEKQAIDDTDGSSANIWELSTEFAPSSQQRASLSTLFDSAISSWQHDSSNNEYNMINKKESSGLRHSAGLMRNLLHAMGHNKDGEGIHRQTNSIDVAQMNAIIDALFIAESEDNFNNKSSLLGTNHIKLRDANNDLTIYTPWALGLRLKHGTSVPWRSLLWNLMVSTLQHMDQGITASSPTIGSSYIDFLRILWTELTRRIRWHWENLIPIPNVDSFLYRPSASDHGMRSDGTILGIDLSFNILHQKMAMINCCIHQSIAELPDDDTLSPSPLTTTDTGPATGKTTVDTCTGVSHSSDILVEKTSSIPIDAEGEKSWHFGTSSDLGEGEYLLGSMDDDNEDDDDSIDKETVVHQSNIFKKEDQQPTTYSYSSSTFSELIHPASLHESFVGLDYSTSTESDLDQHRFITTHDGSTDIIHTMPTKSQDHDSIEGRSHPHETLLLLKTKMPLWVPRTQCSGFMTEDMIQEQADLFEKLGTSEGATQQRAKLQSAQLSSDMQSFKAANPDAALEDFVRWYSPKDWVEEGSSDQGHLSTRMSEPGNIWQTLWKSSGRIPASRQPSLFNFTREGEKALNYLESRTAHEVFSMLLPTMGLIMYDTLASQPAAKYIRPVTLSLIQLADELIHYPWDALRDDTCNAKKIVFKVKYGESILCDAISLLQKLSNEYNLVERLLVNSMAQVVEGDERMVVRSLYQNKDGTMLQTAGKEYVLYTKCDLSGIGNRLPQRQYILVKNNEMRLFDMFSE